MVPDQVASESSSQDSRTIRIAAAILAGFALVHTPLHILLPLYDQLLSAFLSAGAITQEGFHAMASARELVFRNVIVPLKNILFLPVILVLLGPVLKAALKRFKAENAWGSHRRIFRHSSAAFLILAALTIPDRLGLMGRGYAQVSSGLFGIPDASGLVYRRILMPAVAYYLQLQGPVLYALFSVAVAFALVYSIVWYFHAKNIQLTLLQTVSIGTAAFVATHFQSPGYPEQLAVLLLLVGLTAPLDDQGKICLAALAMLTHEAVAVVLLPLAWFRFSRRAFRGILAVIGAYCLFWLASHGFDVARALASHSMGGHSGIWWIAEQPVYELLGLFFAYKLLWLFIVAALVLASWKERRYVAAMLAGGAVLSVAGVDTTRMMAFSFLALVASLEVILRNERFHPEWTRLVMILNVCVPSLYVGLNAGVHVYDGMYKLLLQGVLVSPSSLVF